MVLAKNQIQLKSPTASRAVANLTLAAYIL